jgi:protocatechuate 3,4-dioxygenase beta subunit
LPVSLDRPTLDDMIDNDDAPIGRVLSRREVLTLLGASALVACAPTPAASPAPTVAPTQATSEGSPVATAAGGTPTPAPVATPGAVAAVPSCIVRPALTEGPFFVDTKLDRSDIRETRPGIPLALTINVSRLSGGQCRSLQGAVVDVWHCDAAGAYSGVAQNNTSGQRWLRGLQTTDGNGTAKFTTIYPGWYPGRAVHIHFKVRTSEGGRTSDFTSQLFFDEKVNDEVFAQAPYAQHAGSRTRNETDGIFRGSDGKLTLVTAKSGSGYTAMFDIGLA